MSGRRSIGEILVDIGRVSAEEIATALEYQRENGGYFGEALVSCGLVREEELEWGLASQFDMPYIFPDADSIDPEMTAIVSQEWALENLTLPIVRTDTSLRVVIESPLRTDSLDELRDRTGLEVEVALASPSAIREVIRQVYARGAAAVEEVGVPLDLEDALGEVLRLGSPRFGISVRGSRATTWWDDRGRVHRRPTLGDWRSDLDRMMVPGVSEMVYGKVRAEWEAEFHRDDQVIPSGVQFLADESGREYLFTPGVVESPPEARFTPPPPGIVSEVRLLARAGTARFIVATDPISLGHEILPHLPSMLLDPSWRSIYISARDQGAAEEAFSLKMPSDPSGWALEIESLRAFHFDVVTADLDGADKTWAASALDIVAAAFLLWPDGDGVQPALEAGIRWLLRIHAQAGDHLEWSIEPLHPQDDSL